jgi:DNA-binding NarL/FixJ family response regulator
MTQALADLALDVNAFACAEDAIKAIVSNEISPAIVICDHDLGADRMSGAVAIGRLSEEPRCAGTSFFLWSGVVPPKHTFDRAVGYLPKAISPEHLAVVVRSVLRTLRPTLLGSNPGGVP